MARHGTNVVNRLLIRLHVKDSDMLYFGDIHIIIEYIELLLTLPRGYSIVQRTQWHTANLFVLTPIVVVLILFALCLMLGVTVGSSESLWLINLPNSVRSRCTLCTNTSQFDHSFNLNLKLAIYPGSQLNSVCISLLWGRWRPVLPTLRTVNLTVTSATIERAPITSSYYYLKVI